jgi:hypothetical protein
MLVSSAALAVLMSTTPLVAQAVSDYYSNADNDIAFIFNGVPSSTYNGAPVTGINFRDNLTKAGDTPQFGGWGFRNSDNSQIGSEVFYDGIPLTSHWVDEGDLNSDVLIAILRLSAGPGVNTTPELIVWYHPDPNDERDSFFTIDATSVTKNYVPASIPEPPITALLGFGALAMAFARNRRKVRR